MKPNEIIFDDNKEMYIVPDELHTEICISISDGLMAFEEELSDAYKSKIADLINHISNWYNKALKAVGQRAKQIYHVDFKEEDVQLMNIIILFEQGEKELYGLEFRVAFDIEHGCGLQISHENDNYEIQKVGSGDIAFC